MNFFKFLNFLLKSSEIRVGLRFQLASVTINFTDNRDYRAVLYSVLPGRAAAHRRGKRPTAEAEGVLVLMRRSVWKPILFS
jgi:hypothetical protein